MERIYVSYSKLSKHRGQERVLNLLGGLITDHHVIADVVCGKMRLDIEDHLQREIVRKGAYEPKTLALAASLLSEGDCFLDVGAHVGQYSLLASKAVGPSGKVISIEPNPQTFENLKANIELNQAANITMALTAVSSAPALVRFAFPPAHNRGVSRAATSAEQPGYFVGSFDLSEILRATGVSQAKLMKVDVEGAERQVLSGLPSNRALLPTHLIFEYLPEYFHYDIGPRAFLDEVIALGYELKCINGNPFDADNPLPENNLWATLRS